MNSLNRLTKNNIQVEQTKDTVHILKLNLEDKKEIGLLTLTQDEFYDMIDVSTELMEAILTTNLKNIKKGSDGSD